MKWYIDFSGYCVVEGETREEAEQNFWAGLQPPSTNAFDNVYDVDGIEEKDETVDKLFNKWLESETN